MREEENEEKNEEIHYKYLKANVYYINLHNNAHKNCKYNSKNSPKNRHCRRTVVLGGYRKHLHKSSKKRVVDRCIT